MPDNETRQPESEAETLVRGSCLCGAVRYQMQPPYRFFQYCHCSRCRKRCGSAFAANILIDADRFSYTEGQNLVNRYEVPGARHFSTCFCGQCGASLPWHTKDGLRVLVPAGTLDSDPFAGPERNIYWGSRASWYEHTDQLPCFDTLPGRS